MTKFFSNPVVLIVIGFLALNLLGLGSLRNKQVDINTANSEVWNQLQTAKEVINRSELLTIAAMDDRQEVVSEIVSGRDAVNAAFDLYENGEISQEKLIEIVSLQAEGLVQFDAKFVAENYPELDLSEVQLSALDEMSGSMRRIAFARKHLAETQGSYNKLRTWIPLAWFTTQDVEVIQEDADPTAELPDSNFENDK